MSIEFKENNNLLIATPGEKQINLRNATLLKSEILKYIDNGQKHVLVNLAHVSSIDSSGLGSLISIGQKLLAIGGSLSFCNVAPSIESIFNTTNINTVFSIFSDENSALANYKAKENLPSIAFIGTDLAFYKLLCKAAKSIGDVVLFDKAQDFIDGSAAPKASAILIEEAMMNEALTKMFNKNDSMKVLPKLLIAASSTSIKHQKQLKASYNISHIIKLPITVDEAKSMLSEIIKAKQFSLSSKETSPTQQLFEHYTEGLSDKLEELEILFEKLKNSKNEENAKALHAAVHKMSGSAGSYGYVKAGQNCKHLELLLEKAILEKAIDTIHFAEAENLIKKINFHFNTTFYRDPNQQNSAIRPVTSQSLFVITQNEGIASFFKSIAKKWNFQIAISKVPEQATEELLQLEFKPELIITENKFSGSPLTGINLIKAIKNKLAAEKITFGLLVEEDSLDVSITASAEGIDFLIKKPPSAKHVAKVFENFIKDLNSPPYKILVIDDDIDIGNLITNAMDGYNVNIKTLTDETKMLETLYEFGPNLLLLDIHLKKYDGWSLLKTLRSDLRYRDLKIVIITASLDAKHLPHDLHDDLWLKPLDKTELQNNLLQFANQHHSKSTKEHIFTSFSSRQEFKKLSLILLNAARGQDPYYFTIIAAKEFSTLKELGPGATQEYLIACENLMSEKIHSDSIRGYLGNGKFGFIFPPMEQDKLMSQLEEFCTSSDYKISISSKKGNLFLTFREKTERYLPEEKNAASFLDETLESFQENCQKSSR